MSFDKLLAVAFAALAAALAPVAASAATVTLPVNFWGGGVTLEQGSDFVYRANAIFAGNGVNLRLTLGGVGGNKTCSDVYDQDGINVVFLPSEQISGGLEQASSNSLPLGANSGFCARLATFLLDPAPGYAAYASETLVHAIGHMMSLGHTPGTIMSQFDDGSTGFEPWQVDILNQAAPQAATPPAKAANGGLLLNKRFTVQARWKISSGGEGSGLPVALTSDSGYLWFFSPTNIEVTVKVLDACAFESLPRFWVFAAGMTDVEVILTVTDTETAGQKIYKNPMGKPFLPILDTDAFATCP